MLVVLVVFIVGVNIILVFWYFKVVIVLLNCLNCEMILLFNFGMEVEYWIFIVFF